MAKRDWWYRAPRGYQVSQWRERGTLKAAQLSETPILIVLKAARVYLKTKRGIIRITLGQGTFLGPLWIRAPKADLEKFPHLSEEELREKGIIKVNGEPHLLIYRRVADIDYLCRQQQHVLGRGAGRAYFERHIKPHIVARQEAAESLRQLRKQQLKTICDKLDSLRKRLEEEKKPTPQEVIGINRYLDGIIAGLEEIIERPVVTRRKRAQRSLRSAQRWLGEGNFYLARKRLAKALENLEWPEE